MRGPEFERLWSSSLGLLRVWMAHVGRKRGLLAALATGAETPPALARTLQLDARSTQQWCEAAHALELVERSGDRYRVTPRMVELLLDEEHPDFLGGQLSYLALRTLDLDGLDGLLRTGASADQPHVTEAYGEATRWDHTMALGAMVEEPALRRRLEMGARVLDVGCGTAGWDVAVAERFPRARFVGVDHDETAVDRGRRRVKEAGFEDRIELRLGDGAAVAADEEFDVVHLGEVLCRAEDRAGILTACRRALRPDGWLIVVEGLLDERADPRSHEQQMVRAMQLEFALQGARFLERAELRGMLTRAGLGVEREVHAGGGLWIVLARRA